MMLFDKVFTKDVKLLSGAMDRKTAVVGTGKFIKDCKLFQQSDNAQVVASLIKEVVQQLLMTASGGKNAQLHYAAEDDEFYTQDVEEAGYQSAYVKLHATVRAVVDPAPQVANAE